MRHDRIFPGASAAATMLRSIDWPHVGRGVPASWPAGVRASLALCLTSAQPMLMAWGDLVFANDAWASPPLAPDAPIAPALIETLAQLQIDRAWLDAPPKRLAGDLAASPVFSDAGELEAIVLTRDAAAAVAHRLRQPLGPLLVTLDLMKLAPSAASIDVIERQVRELVGLLDGDGAKPATAPPPVRAGKRRRVLVVEDHDPTAQALEAALSALGYEVAIAHDGPVALSVGREFKPDVALVDICLPVMDGWDLAERMRALAVEPRFVAVTARAADADRQRSTEVGFADHLVKPVDMARLVAVIDDET